MVLDRAILNIGITTAGANHVATESEGCCIGDGGDSDGLDELVPDDDESIAEDSVCTDASISVALFVTYI